MKITAILYSVLIFISCANNTAKDTPKENPISKTSDRKTVEMEKVVVRDSARDAQLIAVVQEEADPKDMDSKEVTNAGSTDSRKTPDKTVLAEPVVTIAKEQKVDETSEVNNAETADQKEENEEPSPDEAVVKAPVVKVPSHKSWDILLQKYVDNAGNVDYGAFRNSKANLSDYLEELGSNAPKSDWSKNEKLAYYINLYNAATVKLILDNYPTKSIKDIKKPWGKDIVKVGQDLVSLGYIEHKVLRKMNEPRIHFAINCASYSCPKLVNKAFTAAAMEQQLEAATKDFVNDRTRNQFSPEEAKLSEIFRWYKGDFTEKGSLKEYINNYLATPMTAATKIKYLKYNWNLNEK